MLFAIVLWELKIVYHSTLFSQKRIHSISVLFKLNNYSWKVVRISKEININGSQCLNINRKLESRVSEIIIKKNETDNKGIFKFGQILMIIYKFETRWIVLRVTSKWSSNSLCLILWISRWGSLIVAMFAHLWSACLSRKSVDFIFQHFALFTKYHLTRGMYIIIASR